mgnify:CR=1 FL=1
MSQNENNLNKRLLYKDFPLSKKLTNGGDLDTIENSDALAQAFKIWISSARGEKVRSISGGYLIPFLGKGVTPDNAERIRKQIITGLENDFVPAITVQDLQVIPNQEKSSWLIILTGYNETLNIGLNTYVNIRDRGY